MITDQSRPTWIGIVAVLAALCGTCPAHAGNAGRIQPYAGNPTYWQYQGKPVMLLGGSKTDHLFLLEDLAEHLDELRAVGGNYVRNTMSQREGKQLKPHRLLPDGTFDLGQWNDVYWQRFEDMLRWTGERDIIVQIEIWDRFDYGAEYWTGSPWNPKNNISYSAAETGFRTGYSNQDLYRDAHPFFHTIAGTSDFERRYEAIRKYQEAFVDKLLFHSLPHRTCPLLHEQRDLLRGRLGAFLDRIHPTPGSRTRYHGLDHRHV